MYVAALAVCMVTLIVPTAGLGALGKPTALLIAQGMVQLVHNGIQAVCVTTGDSAAKITRSLRAPCYFNKFCVSSCPSAEAGSFFKK